MKKNMCMQPLLGRRLVILCGLLLLCTGLSAQVLLGDVNGDEKVNILDALITAQYSVGLAVANFNSDAADVNGSGGIDILDALMIAQYYVGIIKAFPRPQPTPTPTPQDVDYVTLIQNWARKIGIELSGYVITQIGSVESDRMVPGFVFFHVYLRQYPVAYGNPDKLLGSSCLLAIDRNLNIQIILNEEALLTFFKANQIPAPPNKASAPVSLCKAWLSLSQEFKNDGYYTFVIPEDKIEVYLLEGLLQDYMVTGVSLVASGGEGLIQASLLVDTGGIVISQRETVELITGVRPICQSTKLLDPDPVVRRMAESDLLAMGRSAEAYIQQQRAKASPELQAAMDAIWQRILELEGQRSRIYKLLAH